MAPISSIFRRDDGPNTSVAFYLLLTFTILFFIGCSCAVALFIIKRVRRNRQSSHIESSKKTHRRSRHIASISIYNEKSAFLEDDELPSPTESVPEIRITFPEEQTADGRRHSRVVIVKIGEKGSVGYEPYQEPLPVYKEKESPQFQDLDLEKIGGLREKESLV